MSTGTYNLLNCITQIISALATVSAVCVALYLSRDARRIRLDISAGIRVMVSMGQKVSDAPVYVMIEAVNLSLRPVTIVCYGWVLGRWRKSQFIQTPANDALSSAIPCRLTDGESAKFLIPRPGLPAEC